MSSKPKTVYERIDDLESIIASLKKDVGKPQDLAKDVTALKRSVTALKTDAKKKAPAGSRAGPAAADLDGIRRDVAAMEESISSLRSDMTMLKTIFRSKLTRYEIRAIREGRNVPSAD